MPENEPIFDNTDMNVVNEDNNSNWSEPNREPLKQPDFENKIDEREQTKPVYRRVLDKLNETKYVGKRKLKPYIKDAIENKGKQKISLEKSYNMLNKQASRISIPVKRTSAFKAGGFDKSFVKPYASETSGNFTLTKGNKMEVSTGGYDTEDEFKRNKQIDIYVPQARTGGKLSTPGSLSINMGVREVKSGMSIANPYAVQSYDLPDGMKSMVKYNVVRSNVNRNIQNNNRNEMRFTSPVRDPDIFETVFKGSYILSQEQSVPLAKEVAQDRVNYNKMNNNKKYRIVADYKKDNTIRKFQAPSFSVNVKPLDLKKAHPRTNIKSKTTSNIVSNLAKTISSNTIKRKSSKRK